MSPWHTFDGKFNAVMYRSNNNGIQMLQLGYVQDRKQKYTPKVIDDTKSDNSSNDESDEEDQEMKISEDQDVRMITVCLTADLHENNNEYVSNIMFENDAGEKIDELVKVQIPTSEE